MRAARAAASNIVFIENDKDPWHIGTESVAAALGATPGGGAARGVFRRLARGGAHHQELRFSSPHDARDVAVRRRRGRDGGGGEMGGAGHVGR